MESGNDMLLSVVVPCFNEQDVLPELVEQVFSALDHADADIEIVLAEGGGRDGTRACMRLLSEQGPRVTYVSFSRNFGKESAMLVGLVYARGDAVVFMDGDLQHPPHLVFEMLARYRRGFDRVVARRARDGERFGRTLLSRLYNLLVNALVDVHIEDSVGDFRLLSRRAVNVLLKLGEYDCSSKGLFSWIGFPVVTVDCQNVIRRGGGASEWSFRRLLDYGIDGIMSFNASSLRLSIYLGGKVTMLSLAYVVFLDLLRNETALALHRGRDESSRDAVERGDLQPHLRGARGQRRPEQRGAMKSERPALVSVPGMSGPVYRSDAGPMPTRARNVRGLHGSPRGQL